MDAQARNAAARQRAQNDPQAVAEAAASSDEVCDALATWPVPWLDTTDPDEMRRRANEAKSEETPAWRAVWLTMMLPMFRRAAPWPEPVREAMGLPAIERQAAEMVCDHLAKLPTAPNATDKLAMLTLAVEWEARQPRDMDNATVTATKGFGNAGSMVRRAEILSTLARVAWEDAGPVDGVMVDGEPLSARMTDLSEAFRKPRSRPRRKAMRKPGDQGELIPSPPQGIPRVMPELRMTALEGLPPTLAGDAHTLMTWGHALDTPLRLTETEGAALLSRTRDGEFRRPLDSDRERFRDAMAALRGTLIFDPYRPDSRSPDWREIMDIQRTASGLYVIGPPLWAQELSASGQRWTLTAQGSRATARYKLAGKQSMAGRIVTGLEYRLYARFDSKSGPGPDVRPASGKSGPGPAVFVDWRECLTLAGDWHDPNDSVADEAARQRFNRAVTTLKQHGYFLPTRKGSDGRDHPNLHGSAPAGDSVEIIGRQRGGRGTTGGAGGLLIRASARYVEATTKANAADGKGFESVPLVDYAGEPLLPPPDG